MIRRFISADDTDVLWNGARKAAINGAANGFMWGGVSAGVSTVALASKGTYVNKIGRLKPTSKKNGYVGVRYGVKKQSGNLSYRSIELHSPHKGGPHQVWHWQKNRWSYNRDNRVWSISNKKTLHWTLFWRRL